MTTSEVIEFLNEIYHDFLDHINYTDKSKDEMKETPHVLRCKVYKTLNEMEEEYDVGTTRVGPFKVRTPHAPTVDDRKLLETCFEKDEDTRIVAGVVDNQGFQITKKISSIALPQSTGYQLYL